MLVKQHYGRVVRTDTPTGMLPGIPGSATCVQKFDDSLNSAIRITYRISLRSSSLREPRDPLLAVLINIIHSFLYRKKQITFFIITIIIIIITNKRAISDDSCSYIFYLVCIKDFTVPSTYTHTCAHLRELHKTTFHMGLNIIILRVVYLKTGVVMILPQVHLRKPCYDFTFL